MRFQTCFVVWHGKEPVFSIDFHPSGKIATGGADNTIKIWRFNKENPEKISIEFCANLRRHTRSVNVVRFSPNGEYLASGSDDGFIFVWKHDPNLQPQAQFGDDDDDTLSKEVWTVVSTLRGGSSEIYDLSWSPDSQYIFSGSVDNTACIWDVVQAKQVIEFREHTHYVQGVCWDPQDQYIMTQSSDQTCRVYKRKNKSIKNNSFHCVKVLKKRQINKPTNAPTATVVQITSDASVPIAPDAVTTDNINNVRIDVQANKPVTDHKMFLDETVKSFFRRLSWSPEGSLLFVPTGTIKKTTANGEEDFNTTYVFSRHQLTKPIMHLPLPDKPSLIVRCNPTLFKLRPDSVFKEDMFRGLQLPYRMVYAVATQDGVLIYDTQHANAIVMSNKIHYASITDLSWSNDGYTLGISSSDGYCSFMSFDQSDLGEPLSPEELVAAMKPIEDSKAARVELQLKAKNKVKKNKENIAPNAVAEASKENAAPVVNILTPKKASPIKVLDNFFRPSPTKTTPLKRKADEMDQSPSDQSGTPQPAAKKPRKITPTLISAYAPSLQVQNAISVNGGNAVQQAPQVLQPAPIVNDSVNSGSAVVVVDQAVVPVVVAPIVAEPVVLAPIAVENMSA